MPPLQFNGARNTLKNGQKRIKRDKPLIIKDLSQNILKSRIFAFLRARESLIENTRVLEGIVVKIFSKIVLYFTGKSKITQTTIIS